MAKTATRSLPAEIDGAWRVLVDAGLSRAADFIADARARRWPHPEPWELGACIWCEVNGKRRKATVTDPGGGPPMCDGCWEEICAEENIGEPTVALSGAVTIAYRTRERFDVAALTECWPDADKLALADGDPAARERVVGAAVGELQHEATVSIEVERATVAARARDETR